MWMHDFIIIIIIYIIVININNCKLLKICQKINK